MDGESPEQMTPPKRWKIAFLLLWILGLLFPVFTLGRYSPTFRRVFDWVFQTEAAHMAMRTFLYGTFAMILMSFVPRERQLSRATILCILCLVAVIAAAQEWIQLVMAHIPLHAYELTDWFLDLNAAVLGIGIYGAANQRSTRP